MLFLSSKKVITSRVSEIFRQRVVQLRGPNTIIAFSRMDCATFLFVGYSVTRCVSYRGGFLVLFCNYICIVIINLIYVLHCSLIETMYSNRY